MTYEVRLARIAEQIAYDRASQVEAMKKKKLKILNEAAELETQIAHCADAIDRFASYATVENRNYQCPVCWIEKRKRAVVAPAGDLGRVFYRCDACGWEDEHHL